MKPSKFIVIFSLAAAFLVVGCGGGDSSTADSSSGDEPAPAQAAAPSEPIGSATISGVINFEGTAPESSRLRLDADCSALHDGVVMSQNYVISEEGNVANVFVYVKEGLSGHTFTPPAEPAVIDQHGCMYSPHVLGVQVGQNLQILNSDTFLNNINGQANDNRPFNFGMPKQGDERERSFRVPEIMLPIKCDVHPWMSAYLGVVEHPFFTVSDTDGSFSIEGLPAGDYVLEAWHEEFGTQTMSVSVTDGGSASADFTYTSTGAAD
jgi:hypothetical protein